MLVREYQLVAVRAAYLILRDREAAEDVVSNAFLKVRDRIGQYDTNRAFKPWFLRIVVNDAVKAATRSKRDVSIERDLETAEATLSSLVSTDATPAESLEAADTHQAIWDALGALSVDQRAVIVMKYYLELKETEIAARLNRPRGTVKWLLHRARKNLRLILTPLRHGEADQ